MNADVFITIVYSGTAVLVAVMALVLILPQIRREEVRYESPDARRTRPADPPEGPARDGHGGTSQAERGVPVQ
jgi:hypothetical protein